METKFFVSSDINFHLKIRMCVLFFVRRGCDANPFIPFVFVNPNLFYLSSSKTKSSLF